MSSEKTDAQMSNERCLLRGTPTPPEAGHILGFSKERRGPIIKCIQTRHEANWLASRRFKERGRCMYICPEDMNSSDWPAGRKITLVMDRDASEQY